MRWWPFSKPETKSLSEPTTEELLIFTGAIPTEGLVGSAEAITVPAIQSAIHLIAGSIASFDILVERRAEEAWVSDTEHPVARLLADQPNDWQATHELIRDLIATALTVDKGGVALVNRVEGRPIEIIRYEPGHVAVDYSSDGRLEPSFQINNRPIPSRDIIHLRGPYARSPLTMALSTATLLHRLETQARNLMNRGARPSGVIETPKAVGDDGVKRILKGWRAAHEGPSNAGRTAVLYDGATWRQLSLSAVDAEFIATWKMAILEVARIFRVPPGMLYDFDRQTWSNLESSFKEWLASLELWMRPLEAAMRRALFTDEERPDWRVRFARDDFTNTDLSARATAISSLISARVLNPDEGRDWLGMPPRADGKGGEFANPFTGSNQPGVQTPPPADEEADAA